MGDDVSIDGDDDGLGWNEVRISYELSLIVR